MQYLAQIEKLQAVILEVREAGWVGVEADPADLTFQDLQVFLSIICSYYCRLLSLSIIGNSKAFTAPMVVLVLFYSVVTSVNVDI